MQGEFTPRPASSNCRCLFCEVEKRLHKLMQTFYSIDHVPVDTSAEN